MSRDHILSEKEIDTDKEEFNISIEVWNNDENVKLHFIDGYITQTAKSFVVDETNIDLIKNSEDSLCAKKF